MASYQRRVKADIVRWQEAGWLDAATAERLSKDVEAGERSRISFGGVVGTLAAILVAAAILLFVAADWQAIPRLMRVGLLCAVIAAGYLGGALIKLRGAYAWGEALYLIAATAFGASILLISRMYHLSGSEVQAFAVWATGAALAAVALRSPILTVGSILLAAAWMVATSQGFWSTTPPSPWFLLAALLLWLTTFWTGSAPGRVLIVLSLLLYGALLTLERETISSVPFAMAGISVAAFVFAVTRPQTTQRVAGLGASVPVLCLLGFLVAMGLSQLLLEERIGLSIVLAVLVLAGLVAALISAGRQNRRLRQLVYAGFTAELIYIYAAYLGTRLDTATFFLAAGLVLALVAVVVRRVEKRLVGVDTLAAAEGADQ